MGDLTSLSEAFIFTKKISVNASNTVQMQGRYNTVCKGYYLLKSQEKGIFLNSLKEGVVSDFQDGSLLIKGEEIWLFRNGNSSNDINNNE